MKTKRAMKEYTCAECKGTIRKGDQYARKQVTIGRRGDEWTENINGYPTIVQNWMTYDARLCNECANGKQEPPMDTLQEMAWEDNNARSLGLL